jgi:dTDP-4-dehydrorhamnose reductase
MVEGLRAGKRITVFYDRTVSPTYIPDAARATRELLERSAAPGLYHCVNSGRCTWLELAHTAARLLGLRPRLQPVRLGQVPLKATRPQYCALSNEKLRANGIDLPHWRHALRRYLQSLRDERAHQPAHRE